LADDFILETRGLTKEFAGFFAVRDVDLRVRRGSIHALIGPNGAGKTTCFNLLTKFLRPSAGEIRYKGRDITALAPADVARLGLARSFQISAVFPHLTALENVRVALQRQHGHSFDFWRSKTVLDRFNHRAHELLDDVGLSEFATTPAVEMPYGRKRALEIATTLALDGISRSTASLRARSVACSDQFLNSAASAPTGPRKVWPTRQAATIEIANNGAPAMDVFARSRMREIASTAPNQNNGISGAA